MASPAKPAWAVEPAGHVEAMLVLGDAPGEQRFRLDVPGKAAYKLGRLAEQCDIHVQSAVASRLHAIIGHHKEGGLCIVDMNSANGTFVDGNRLPGNIVTPLPDGTRIRFGDSEEYKTVIIDKRVDAKQDFLSGLSGYEANETEVERSPAGKTAKDSDGNKSSRGEGGREARRSRSRDRVRDRDRDTDRQRNHWDRDRPRDRSRDRDRDRDRDRGWDRDRDRGWDRDRDRGWDRDRDRNRGGGGGERGRDESGGREDKAPERKGRWAAAEEQNKGPPPATTTSAPRTGASAAPNISSAVAAATAAAQAAATAARLGLAAGQAGAGAGAAGGHGAQAGAGDVVAKRKMLWGSKPKEASTSNTAVWSSLSSSLGDSEAQNKFLKLMGGKKPGNDTGGSAAPVDVAHVNDMQYKLQREFEDATRRMGGKSGLG